MCFIYFKKELWVFITILLIIHFLLSIMLFRAWFCYHFPFPFSRSDIFYTGNMTTEKLIRPNMYDFLLNNILFLSALINNIICFILITVDHRDMKFYLYQSTITGEFPNPTENHTKMFRTGEVFKCALTIISRNFIEILKHLMGHGASWF